MTREEYDVRLNDLKAEYKDVLERLRNVPDGDFRYGYAYWCSNLAVAIGRCQLDLEDLARAFDQLEKDYRDD